MTSFLVTLSAAFCLLTAGASGQSVRFAVIGDFGVDDANELAVANLVKNNLRPEFIVTVGDNHYNGATAIDRDIGKYFHDYIGNYRGTYGAGASSNRIFPAIGNHDYSTPGGYSNHLSYFPLNPSNRFFRLKKP